MTIWVTSDLHFFHNKEFLYKPRGFNSIEEHNEIIVQNWNKIIKSSDTVYLLGDLILNNNEDGVKLLNQLQGKIYYIRGNHCTDVRCMLYKERTHMIPLCGDFFTSWASLEKIKGYSLYLSHYPTMVGSLEDMSPLNKRLINLHGHTHSKNKFYQDIPFMYNVALDAHNNTPVSFDEIIADIEEEKNKCLEML